MIEDVIWLQKLEGGAKLNFNQLVGFYKERVINTCYKFLRAKGDAELISP